MMKVERQETRTAIVEALMANLSAAKNFTRRSLETTTADVAEMHARTAACLMQASANALSMLQSIDRGE